MASEAAPHSSASICMTTGTLTFPLVTGFLIFFYLPASQKDAVKAGMAVRIGTDTGKVSQTGTADDGRTVCTVEPDRGITPPPDGEYDAELILERTTPISFLWD